MEVVLHLLQKKQSLAYDAAIFGGWCGCVYCGGVPKGLLWLPFEKGFIFYTGGWLRFILSTLPFYFIFLGDFKHLYGETYLYQIFSFFFFYFPSKKRKEKKQNTHPPHPTTSPHLLMFLSPFFLFLKKKIAFLSFCSGRDRPSPLPPFLHQSPLSQNQDFLKKKKKKMVPHIFPMQNSPP